MEHSLYMKCFSARIFVFLTALITTFSSINAHNLDELGIRASALCGAYRAIASDNDALYYNPAGIAQTKRYSIRPDYIYNISSNDHLVGVSIADSQTNVVAAGVDYHLGIDPTATAYNFTHQARLAVAYAPLEFFSFALEGKYFVLPSADSQSGGNYLTADAGILATLPFGMSFAAVGYNLVPTSSDQLPMAFALGSALMIGGSPVVPNGLYSGLTVAFDWRMKDLLQKDKIKHSLHAGAEFLLFEIVPIRAGYQVALASAEHSISFGAGFASPVVGVDLLFDLGIINSSKKAIGAGITVFL